MFFRFRCFTASFGSSSYQCVADSGQIQWIFFHARIMYISIRLLTIRLAETGVSRLRGNPAAETLQQFRDLNLHRRGIRKNIVKHTNYQARQPTNLNLHHCRSIRESVAGTLIVKCINRIQGASVLPRKTKPTRKPTSMHNTTH